MTIRKVDMDMLLKLSERGYPVDFEVLDAPFNLTITSITSMDVDNKIITSLSEKIKKLVRKYKFECEIYDILIFVLVLNPEVQSLKDRLSWSSVHRSYKIWRRLDFDLWSSNKSSENKKLLTNCFIEAINAIPSKRLSDPNKAILEAIICEAAGSKRSNRRVEENFNK